MQTIVTQLLTNFFLFLLFIPVLRAQTVSRTQLPFHYARNLIYVNGSVQAQSGFFLIDTGYEGKLLLNAQYFTGKQSMRVLVGANGGNSTLETKTVEFLLADIYTPAITAEITDLAHLETCLETPLLGLIGSGFLQDFELVIDYETQEITLTRLDRRGNRLASDPELSSPTDSLPFVQKGHLPVFKAQIGENTLRLALDSGASTNLFHQSTFKKLQDHISDVDELRMNSFGSRSKAVKTGRIPSIQLEGLTLAPAQALFHSLAHINRELRGPALDGILSLELFGQHRIAVNYKKHMLYIWTEETIHEPITEPQVVQAGKPDSTAESMVSSPQ